MFQSLPILGFSCNQETGGRNENFMGNKALHSLFIGKMLCFYLIYSPGKSGEDG